jgi:hypothetical protein
VFGKHLALGEAEDDRLEPIILKYRAAEDTVRRRLGFFGEIEDSPRRCVGVSGPPRAEEFGLGASVERTAAATARTSLTAGAGAA